MTIMTRAERAQALHNKGFACSQAVIGVFAEDLGLPAPEAFRLACGFGGGIGRLGLTCGALTGGVLVLSLAFGNAEPEDQRRKMDCADRVAALVREFGASQGSTECRSLLGEIDVRNEADRARMKAQNLSVTVCNSLIKTIVERLEDILRTEGKLA